MTELTHGLDQAWREVREFHRTFGLPVNEIPTKISNEIAQQRASWIEEELEEFLVAADLVSQVDAMADLIYLALGIFAELGVPPGQVFAMVHKANLAKVWADGSVRFDGNGKVVKPIDWLNPEPEIQDFLESLAAKAAR